MDNDGRTKLGTLYHSGYVPTEDYLGAIQAQQVRVNDLKMSLDVLADQRRDLAGSRLLGVAYMFRRLLRRAAGRPVARSARIIMFNAADCDNLGDDLLIDGAQAYLARQLPKAAFTLAVRERESLPAADLAVVGPGGLIYDFDERNVSNYCDAIEYANHLRKPIYLMGVGTQGVTKKSALVRYQRALNLVRWVNVRDETDAAFLTQHQLVEPRKLLVTADFVFMRGFSHPHPVRDGQKPKLLLTLADWQLGDANYNKIEAKLDQAVAGYKSYAIRHVARLKETFDVTILAQTREDRDFAAELGRAAGIEPVIYERAKNLDRILRLYAEADVVVTSRYHGFILGITSGALTIPVTLPGSKTARLVESRFPSLKAQACTVREFTSRDVLGGLTQNLASLRRPSWQERRAVKRSFKPLKIMMRDMKGYIEALL